MATNVWLGRFRRYPWEFLAVSVFGALFSAVRAATAPSAPTSVAAVVSVVGIAALAWFFFSFSMYGAREDRPRVGELFPAFQLTASDGELYDSRADHGTRRLFIFYRGSW